MLQDRDRLFTNGDQGNKRLKNLEPIRIGALKRFAR